jgi:hypothetical protein
LGIVGGIIAGVWKVATGTEPGVASIAGALVIGLLATAAIFALLDLFVHHRVATEAPPDEQRRAKDPREVP